MKHLLLLTSLALSLGAVAKDHYCNRKPGSTQCTAGTIPQLNAHGIVWLHGTTIQKKCTVHGLLHAQDAHLYDLVLMGQGDISNTDIQRNALVHGLITLKKTQIKGTLWLHANHMSAHDSHIASIEVHSEQQKPTVSLTGSSQVTNNIVFIGAAGTVTVHAHAHVQGKVVNGTVVRA